MNRKETGERCLRGVKYTQEEWDGFRDEPYVCVPLALCQDFLKDNLKKMRDGMFDASGEVAEDSEIATLKALSSGLIGFCNYCEENHTN